MRLPSMLCLSLGLVVTLVVSASPAHPASSPQISSSPPEIYSILFGGFSGISTTANNVVIVGLNPLTNSWSSTEQYTAIPPPVLPFSTPSPAPTPSKAPTAPIITPTSHIGAHFTTVPLQATLQNLCQGIVTWCTVDVADFKRVDGDVRAFGDPKKPATTLQKATDDFLLFGNETQRLVTSYDFHSTPLSEYQHQINMLLGVEPAQGNETSPIPDRTMLASDVASIKNNPWPDQGAVENVLDTLKKLLTKVRADAAKDTQQYPTHVKQDSALLDQLSYLISSDQARLSPLSSANHDAYNKQLSAVNTQFSTIESLTITSFMLYPLVPSCNLTFGGGSDTKFTVTVVDSKGSKVGTYDITFKCLPRTFVSVGFAFGGPVQKTFSTVAQNPQTVSKPSPVPYQIVQASSSLPTLLTFVNSRIGSNSVEEGWYFSFGVSASSNTTTPINFGGGFSYTPDRYLSLSVGGFLGQRTNLAPGYSATPGQPGNLVPPNFAVPTVNHTVTQPFFGISYAIR